jgi:hypothetical protein
VSFSSRSLLPLQAQHFHVTGGPGFNQALGDRQLFVGEI